MLELWDASRKATAALDQWTLLETLHPARSCPRPLPTDCAGQDAATPRGRARTPLTAQLALVRAISAVVFAVTQLVRGQADGGVVGTGM